MMTTQITLMCDQNKILIEVAGERDRYIHANPDIWAPAIARTKARRKRYGAYCYESPDCVIVTTDATSKENINGRKA